MFLQKQKTSLRHVCLNYFNHSQKKKKRKYPISTLWNLVVLKVIFARLSNVHKLNVITLITYTTPVCCDIL